jgi:hypothetical protein
MDENRSAELSGRFRTPLYLAAPPSAVDGAVCRIVGDHDLVWTQTWRPSTRSWEYGGCECREVLKAPPASAAMLARFNVPPSDLPPDW